MFQHFTFQPFLSAKSRRKNYQFSFFYQNVHYHGIYHYNGKIEWNDPMPIEESRSSLEEQVHELMLFHVYDK